MKQIAILTIILFYSCISLGQDPPPEESELVNIDYPELLVTPSATDRVLKVAKTESSRTWASLIPMQVSALATLAAASQADGDYTKDASLSRRENLDDATQFGMIAGGGWLAVTVGLGFAYRPYRKAFSEYRQMPRKTKRDKLSRERYAEESMSRSAKLINRLKWLNFGTQFAASTYIALTGAETAAIYGGLSALAAFAPFIFEPHWEEQFESHRQYKKKIYGPVGVLMPTAEGVVPGMQVGFSF